MITSMENVYLIFKTKFIIWINKSIKLLQTNFLAEIPGKFSYKLSGISIIGISTTSCSSGWAKSACCHAWTASCKHKFFLMTYIVKKILHFNPTQKMILSWNWCLNQIKFVIHVSEVFNVSLRQFFKYFRKHFLRKVLIKNLLTTKALIWSNT